MNKYIRGIESLIDQSNLGEKILKLEQTSTIPLTEEEMHCYEGLDKKITRCMLKAQKKCCKLYIALLSIVLSEVVDLHISPVDFLLCIFFGNLSNSPLFAFGTTGCCLNCLLLRSVTLWQVFPRPVNLARDTLPSPARGAASWSSVID